MKNNYCAGFFYDTEEELQKLMGTEAYLDMVHGSGKRAVSSEDSKWTEVKSSMTVPLRCRNWVVS